MSVSQVSQTPKRRGYREERKGERTLVLYVCDVKHSEIMLAMCEALVRSVKSKVIFYFDLILLVCIYDFCS